MNWYVKLFAPAIVAAILAGAGILLAWLDFDALLPTSDRSIGFTLATLTIWGAIQTLYFPKRPHKARLRGFLLASIGFYAAFFFFAILTNNPGQEWLYALLGGALMASISYGLRYRPTPYSLAPGWAQLKFMGVLFSLVGLSIICFFALDQMFFKILRPFRLANTFGPYFPIACAVSSIGGILCYYVEAILHHRRNSIKNWQKSINKMGDT